ncbi:hypothetical protein MBLNU13_g06841t2 [Cladosporium sp. NU13]
MPSLILVVFVIQLAIHMISTFGGQAINDLLWLLYTKLPTPQSKQAAAGVTLRKEVVKLHREMTNTSAQDDFAKWAKLRRQHDKKKAEYEQNAQSLKSFRTNFDRVASALRWLGTSGARFVIQFWFSKQALFWIPQGWAPYYVEWLLSFPRAPLGSVSVNMWWIACASVIKMASEGLVALWTLNSGEVKVGEKKGEKVKMDFSMGGIRIGGFQQEIADDEKNREILKNQPDATPLYSVRDALHPSGFLVLDNWKMAVIEGLGTCLLVFALGAGASGLTTLQVSPMAISLYASLLNFVGLSLFIMAAAPASGGHLNPSITMATFFAGLSTLPRSVLYIVAQTLGAIVAGYWLKLGLGEQFFPVGTIPGCTIDPAQVSPGQLFALEYMFALGLMFLAFGVGLDPRQGKTLGPALGPILVGVTLGFATLASSAAKPGYTGVCE